MRPRRILLVFLCLSMLASACSGGGNADQDAVDAAIAAFEERAESAGYRVDDEDDDSDDFEFTSAECKEFEEAVPGDGDDELPGETASAESASFTSGEFDGRGGVERTLEGAAGMVESAADLDDFFELLRDDRFPGCLREAMEAGMAAEAGDDTSVSLVRFDSRVEDLAGVGDQALALHIVAVIGVEGLEFPFALRFGFAGQGRSAAMVAVGAIGAEQVDDVSEALRLLLTDLPTTST